MKTLGFIIFLVLILSACKSSSVQQSPKSIDSQSRVMPKIDFDALETIRMPLVQFESQGLSISSIQKVEFKFPSNWGDSGSIRKVTIDNVMFTV